jgi:hypothetical protein
VLVQRVDRAVLTVLGAKVGARAAHCTGCASASPCQAGRRRDSARWRRPFRRSSTCSARPWPPGSIPDVLGEAIRAAELGAGAGQALAAAARVERLSELELAGEALDLAETTGAPPGPVLAGVATAATDRVRSSQAVLAATAQARLSARVVSAMAPAFFGVLALTSPSDAAFLFREPIGWATLTAATVLELLGICWATRIVRGSAP